MIEAVHISKSFDGVPVISELSLVLKAGGHYCLMGPSGCGKTTLVCLLMGLMKPDSGEVRAKRGLKLSAVFQEDRLLEQLSAVKNVQFASQASADDIKSMLLALGLEKSDLQKPVSAFSGGMKRRVALCRALISDHDVLFLDEPYKGLDDDTRDTVMDIVQKRTTGKTVVLVTHDIAEATGFEIISMATRHS